MWRHIGVDPSLNGTGICTHDAIARSLVFKGRVMDPKNDSRLSKIYREVFDAAIDASVACVEDLPPYQKGSASLGLAQGAVRTALAACGVTVYGISPSTLKKSATGSGSASKDAMRGAMLECISNMPHLAAVEEAYLSWDDNAVDAWWLRQIALAIDGKPNVLAEMPGKWTQHN